MSCVFSRPTPGRRAMTEFTGGGTPKLPTSQWQGRVVTGTNWTITIPTNMPLGDYEILVALTDPLNRGSRPRLLGDEDSRRRCRVGKIVVEGNNKTNVTNVRLEKPEKEFVPSARWLANAGLVNFGPVQTPGAFRCEVRPSQLVLTPLPDGDDFPLRLRLDQVLGRRAEVSSVEALDAKGAVARAVNFSLDAQEFGFTAAKTDFAYRVNLK